MMDHITVDLVQHVVKLIGTALFLILLDAMKLLITLLDCLDGGVY